jgi:hypothetical protein
MTKIFSLFRVVQGAQSKINFGGSEDNGWMARNYVHSTRSSNWKARRWNPYNYLRGLAIVSGRLD